MLNIAVDARPAKKARGTGIGNYTFQLINYLLQYGDENHYSLLTLDGQNEEFQPKRNLDSHVLAVDKGNKDELIPAWLKEVEASVFHMTQNGLGLPEHKVSAYVVTIHDLIPYMVPELVRSGYLNRFVQEMPVITTLADRIITVSNAAALDLQKVLNVPAEKIDVIYPAPEVIFRQLPKDKAKAEIMCKYGIVDDYILYTGGINARKNISELIYAFYKVHRYLSKEYVLVIPGNPDRMEINLAKLIDALNLNNEVILTGFIPMDDMPVLYNAAELFVYPSLYEGFGMPPLEAMACGIPTITSNVSSIPEIVGDAAIKVNPNDALAIANAIYDVLENSRLAADLVEKGFKKVKEFSWKDNALKTLQTYQRAYQNCI